MDEAIRHLYMSQLGDPFFDFPTVVNHAMKFPVKPLSKFNIPP